MSIPAFLSIKTLKARQRATQPKLPPGVDRQIDATPQRLARREIEDDDEGRFGRLPAGFLEECRSQESVFWLAIHGELLRLEFDASIEFPFSFASFLRYQYHSHRHPPAFCNS